MPRDIDQPEGRDCPPVHPGDFQTSSVLVSSDDMFPSRLLALAVFFMETGLVRLAEIGYPVALLTDPDIADQQALPPKFKRLEISNFRKNSDRSKELTNRNTTVGPMTHDSLETALYRLKSDEDRTCILLQVDAIVMFKYMDTLNEEQEKDAFIPNSATVKGDCSDEDKQTLVLKWKSFVLIWYFAKTPGGERWFVPKIDLKFDTTDRSFFEHIKNPGKQYTLSSAASHSTLLFPTPVGKSYKCEREIEVELSSPQTHTVASLLLRDFKLEPFLFKNDDFGPEYMCAATGSGVYRSETAPLIVGSMLAAACLLTISGYAIYRYFTVEKVQYDTME